MSIQVAWDDNNERVLLFQFQDEWTWHECKEALQTAVYLRESANQTVSFIYDITESRIPTRNAMENLQKLITQVVSPAPKHIVIVEKGGRMAMMMETFKYQLANSIPTQVDFVESLARARAITAP